MACKGLIEEGQSGGLNIKELNAWRTLVGLLIGQR